MELRIEQSRGFYSQKVLLSQETINLVRKIDNKYDTYIVFKNGLNKAMQKITTNSFTVPCEVFNVGVLETNIEIFYKGTLVKRIPCDKLIIHDTDNELKAIPEIEKLKTIIEDQNKKIEGLSDKLDFFIRLWKEEL